MGAIFGLLCIARNKDYTRRREKRRAPVVKGRACRLFDLFAHKFYATALEFESNFLVQNACGAWCVYVFECPRLLYFLAKWHERRGWLYTLISARFASSEMLIRMLGSVQISDANFERFHHHFMTSKAINVNRFVYVFYSKSQWWLFTIPSRNINGLSG